MSPLVHCCGCDLASCEGIGDPRPDVAAMAEAGQALAVKWGHQPWSDSWAQLVAEAMLAASADPLPGSEKP